MTRHEIREPTQLDFGRIHKLKVSTIAGKVDVVGDGGPDSTGGATVDVSRISGGEPVIVEEIDGELTVRHGDFKPGLFGWLLGGRKIEADIAISVPPDCLVDVNVVSGPLVVSGLHEQAKVQGVSGEITLAQLHGPTSVKTVSGSITAESVTDDLSAHTVSGSITVIALGESSTIKAGTTSGAITVDLEEGSNSPRVDLNCISGTVIVRVPEDANLDVDMSTMGGRVVTAFPGLNAQPLWPGKPYRRGVPGRLQGTLGTGAGHLKARAVSGDVTLLRRVPDPDFAGDGSAGARGDDFTGTKDDTAGKDH